MKGKTFVQILLLILFATGAGMLIVDSIPSLYRYEIVSHPNIGFMKYDRITGDTWHLSVTLNEERGIVNMEWKKIPLGD